MEKQTTKSTSRPDSSRRMQRIFAFQVLYSLNFTPSLEILEKTFERFQKELFPGRAGKEAFARSIVHGVWNNLESLNEIISSYSKNWRIQRIARIELTILRLAVYEMLYSPDIPIKVAINEAIELAKAFGDENSRNFVNGILDAVARDTRNGKFGISKGF